MAKGEEMAGTAIEPGGVIQNEISVVPCRCGAKAEEEPLLVARRWLAYLPRPRVGTWLPGPQDADQRVGRLAGKPHPLDPRSGFFDVVLHTPDLRHAVFDHGIARPGVSVQRLPDAPRSETTKSFMRYPSFPLF